jgi:hypothetical protein
VSSVPKPFNRLQTVYKLFPRVRKLNGNKNGYFRLKTFIKGNGWSLTPHHFVCLLPVVQPGCYAHGLLALLFAFPYWFHCYNVAVVFGDPVSAAYTIITLLTRPQFVVQNGRSPGFCHPKSITPTFLAISLLAIRLRRSLTV